MTAAIHPYANFIHNVEKPARYMGGEYNSILRDWPTMKATLALCFPDIYDIGMSHMGTKILYSIVNKTDDLAMERCFSPWVDMEKELRDRNLPLLSLETWRPLSDFDVVGFSLQFEMTYTNVLTMLDLGGVPLRNSARTLDDPLVIAGGPTATHAEPMAPFIDCFVVGDAEERLPRLLRHYAELKQQGQLSRLEILAEIAKEGGVYCPDLYERDICERSDLMYVSGVKAAFKDVPKRVERAFLDDISRYRFPADSPVAVAEAIFDRMSVEVARGCTEGCRFCQAGMIYRPVRERDPEEIVETVLESLEKGGYDQASITSLSTADYSCISPLIKTLMKRLREKKVSLSISSLRAYGLSDDLLDDIATVKATGLTFAPEAGTQRMRDVINKNITEDDIFTTCHRVFSKGWRKMKLYFIIGLPSEEDADVVGIAEMGSQAVKIGQEYHTPTPGVQVTVSVSSHVPKPHTPFQWVAMDSLEEINRKQLILKKLAQSGRFKFRGHNPDISYLEGILARGDYRTGWLIEQAWRLGTRFDSWDSQIDKDAWAAALDNWENHYDLKRTTFIHTIPTDAKLPWDHINVGLAEKFLYKEYRRALKNRLSPPCGKPVGAKVHHTNLEEANADQRKLVCYHCGVTCDMTQMREERIEFLDRLGAHTPPKPLEGFNVHETAQQRVAKGMSPHDFKQGQRHRYRLRYTKLGPASLQGHLDLVRILPRVMRRAGLQAYYSQGFNPKPIMAFGPALGLGARGLAEYADILLLDELTPQELIQRLNASLPDGLFVTGVRKLPKSANTIGNALNALEYMITLPDHLLGHLISEEDEHKGLTVLQCLQNRCKAVLDSTSYPVHVIRKGRPRTIDFRTTLYALEGCISDTIAVKACMKPGRLAIRFIQSFGSDQPATLRPVEVVAAILSFGNPNIDLSIAGKMRNTVRVACHWIDAETPNQTCDPLEGPGTGPEPIAEMALRCPTPTLTPPFSEAQASAL